MIMTSHPPAPTPYPSLHNYRGGGLYDPSMTVYITDVTARTPLSIIHTNFTCAPKRTVTDLTAVWTASKADRLQPQVLWAIIDSFCTSGTSTLETYYSNLIARQIYAQKCLKYSRIQNWLAVSTSLSISLIIGLLATAAAANIV